MTEARARASRDWAIVTPSYHRDFARCQLLCRSMDGFVQGHWHHYIVVDDPDVALFRPLAGPRRTVLRTHDVLPRGMFRFLNLRLFDGRRLWWSWRTGAVSGWQVQQVLKLNMATLLSERALLFCDSDMFFVRKLALDGLQRGGAVRLYRSAEAQDRTQIANAGFYESSERLLGLVQKPAAYHTYVDNAVTWHRPTAVALLDHISPMAGRAWPEVLRRPTHVSEYTLYGLYADVVCGAAAAVFHDSQSLCKTMWTKAQGQDVAAFCETLSGVQVAVAFQSFIGVDVSLLAAEFDRALGADPGARP